MALVGINSAWGGKLVIFYFRYGRGESDVLSDLRTYWYWWCRLLVFCVYSPFAVVARFVNRE